MQYNNKILVELNEFRKQYEKLLKYVLCTHNQVGAVIFVNNSA